MCKMSNWSLHNDIVDILMHDLLHYTFVFVNIRVDESTTMAWKGNTNKYYYRILYGPLNCVKKMINDLTNII